MDPPSGIQTVSFPLINTFVFGFFFLRALRKWNGSYSPMLRSTLHSYFCVVPIFRLMWADSALRLPSALPEEWRWGEGRRGGATGRQWLMALRAETIRSRYSLHFNSLSKLTCQDLSLSLFAQWQLQHCAFNHSTRREHRESHYHSQSSAGGCFSP